LDFFDSQADALKRSRRLVFLFGAAVASMIAVVYVAVLLALGFTIGVPSGGGAGDWWHPGILGWVSAGMLGIIATGSLIRTAQLRKGGASVAKLLGGRPVDPGTTDPLERRLLNVVEEMAIASGMPVPAVFVLDREPGINAFAAGNTVHDAAVGFTRGSLETLSRDELQGVTAHEFSHILNGDMRLNLRLIGLLFGILLLTVVGRGIVRGSTGAARGTRGRSGAGSQVALVGVALILLGYLGVFFGRLIQAAVSRQREFLADAAAVQFTRNPAGIAGALSKIGGSTGSRVRDHHAQETEHLFFAMGARGKAFGLLATHPPLEARIRRIDPSWDGTFLEPTRDQGDEAAGRTSRASDARKAANRATAMETGPHGGSMAGLPLAAILLGSIGAPEARNLPHARALLERIPAELREASRTPEQAVPLVVALLLPDTHEMIPGLISRVEETLGAEAAGRAEAFRTSVLALDAEARLPLLELALPALRQLPEEEATRLQSTVSTLIRADGQLHPFEFALFHILRRSLAGESRDGRSSRARTQTLSRLRVEVEVVLSALAWAGAAGEGEARSSLESGARHLADAPAGGWRLHPPGAVELDRVDEALDRLLALDPPSLRTLMEAAVATVQGDGSISSGEVELLRAFAEALEAPIPPPPADSQTGGAGE
jgi:Zn-dependent protease with chaperone function